MGTPITFGPANINCGVIQPGGTTTQSTQCSVLSAPVNVTASIADDTSGGALTLSGVASFITKTETETTGPGEGPPGKPIPPVKITVPVQVGESNGVTPLAVASGQYVVVSIQFAPTISTPDTCSATLNIQGDSWNPVSIPIVATVGELSVKVPSITVRQGASATVDVTVTSVAGEGTTAKLILEADEPPEAPNVTVALSASSLPISKGQSVSTKLTVSAGPTLATGAYPWSLAVRAFENAYSFSVPVVIKVAEPYYFIKSKLDGNVIGIQDASSKSGAGLEASPQFKTDTDSQLWEFVPDPAGSGYYFIQSKLTGNVIDISTAAGAPLDAYPQKTTGADNQLWEFVADPAGSGYCFIMSKLTGNVIDISTATGAPLDAAPLKGWYDNQLWTVVDGDFPSVLKKLPAPSAGIDYTVVLLLWGDPQPPPPYNANWKTTLKGPDLSSALTEIANEGYFRLLAQYKVKRITIAGPPTKLTTPPWPAGDGTFTTKFSMQDVANFITASFSSGVPSPDKFSNTQPVYIVITPRGGLLTDNPNFLGEHATFPWGPANINVLYAFVGAQKDLNDTLVTATHEIVEAVGDNGGAPKELCDRCAKLYDPPGATVTAGTDTYSVESYFDAATNQCVAPWSFHKPSK